MKALFPMDSVGTGNIRLVLKLVLYYERFGAIAQLGERLPCTQEVDGSIPSGSTNSTLTSRVTFPEKGYLFW